MGAGDDQRLHTVPTSGIYFVLEAGGKGRGVGRGRRMQTHVSCTILGTSARLSVEAVLAKRRCMLRGNAPCLGVPGSIAEARSFSEDTDGWTPCSLGQSTWTVYELLLVGSALVSTVTAGLMTSECLQA